VDWTAALLEGVALRRKSYPAPHCGPAPGEQGGSRPRDECAGDATSSLIDAKPLKTIDRLGKSDAYRAVERGVIVDKYGGVMQAVDGVLDAEGDYIQLSPEARENLRDRHFTHNHPTGSGLSQQDIMVGVGTNAASISAVGATDLGVFRHTMTRPAGGWPTVEEMAGALVTEDARVWMRLEPKVASGGMSASEAGFMHRHEMMQELEKQGLLRYERVLLADGSRAKLAARDKARRAARVKIRMGR
jgi:hypothetical protein